MKALRPWLISLLLLTASLMALRLQSAWDLGFGFAQALSLRITLGWLYDLSLVLMIIAFTGFFYSVHHRLAQVLFLLLAVISWSATLFNILYFKFFGHLAHFWVVRLHYQDLLQVRGSAMSLASAGWILLSFITLLVAVYWTLNFLGKEKHARQIKKRLLTVVAFFMVFAFALLLRQSPVWVGAQQKAQDQGNVLTQMIFKVWWDETYGLTSKKAKRQARFEAQQASNFDTTKDRLALMEPILRLTGQSQIPYSLKNDEQQQSRMIQALGLPTKGPWHVVILFLESFRAYELDHPVLGPAIFPGLRAEREKRGWTFAQTYSSSIDAGQTVRGQFSTLCSMLPNLLGPAVYLAHYQIRLHCLPSLMKAAGYDTIWMNSHDKHFHNKEIFERLHGMQFFYDRQYFLKAGIQKSIGDWGLADHEVLQSAVEILNRHAEKKPVFAHFLTVGTHHPFTEVPEAPVPLEIKKWLEDQLVKEKDRRHYRGYLSRQRYADMATTQFIDSLFASPMGERTLLVIMGDHGSKIRSSDQQMAYQMTESAFRIPLIFMSKHLQRPQRWQTLAHQMDVAPTLAAILGLQGEVTWTGKKLLQASSAHIQPQVGSAWLYSQDRALSYRYGQTACYSVIGQKTLACYQTKEATDGDPLYATELPQIAEDKQLTYLVKKVVKSNSALISRDLWLPQSQ